MALSTTASRFDFLTDDAADPFEKKKKKTSSAGADGTNSKSKKTAVAGASKPKNSNTASKNATSGSQQEKKKKSASNNDADKKLPVQQGFPELHTNVDGHQRISESSSAEVEHSQENEFTECGKKKSKKGKKTVQEKPKDKDPQWEDWKKRDQEFITGSFESDLEAALVQSKLEHHQDESKSVSNSKSKSRKSKNKPAAVSLSEFNQMIGCGNGGPGLVEPNRPQNSNGIGSIMPPPGLMASCVSELDQEAALMEQFRKESQLEIERERRLEAERAILKSRPSVPIPQGKGKKDAFMKPFINSTPQNENAIPCRMPDHLVQVNLLAERDQTIAELTGNKAQLEEKLADISSKFKKVCSMLSEGQLKDKVMLLRDNEKLTQLNSDLNEQVTDLHSQLEQERSKSSSLSAELRKLEYSRKRTQSHTELN